MQRNRCLTRGLPSAARLTEHRNPTSAFPFAASRLRVRPTACNPLRAAAIPTRYSRTGQIPGWTPPSHINSWPFVVHTAPHPRAFIRENPCSSVAKKNVRDTTLHFAASRLRVRPTARKEHTPAHRSTGRPNATNRSRAGKPELQKKKPRTTVRGSPEHRSPNTVHNALNCNSGRNCWRRVSTTP